ncbi:MAG TPA: RNA-binding protein [Flavisolibacter sp.]|nr:RNA-binding protein [Flavisolibacter sp.]
MTIYVANFSTQLNNDDLKGLFTPYGEVASAEIAIDGFTDKSRGFGYVEMPAEQEARAAIAALNQKEVNGSLLQVQEAEPVERKRGSYKVGNGGVNPYRFRKG